MFYTCAKPYPAYVSRPSYIVTVNTWPMPLINLSASLFRGDRQIMRPDYALFNDIVRFSWTFRLANWKIELKLAPSRFERNIFQDSSTCRGRNLENEVDSESSKWDENPGLRYISAAKYLFLRIFKYNPRIIPGRFINNSRSGRKDSFPFFFIFFLFFVKQILCLGFSRKRCFRGKIRVSVAE